MKRRNRSATPTDPEDQRRSVWEAPSTGASSWRDSSSTCTSEQSSATYEDVPSDDEEDDEPAPKFARTAPRTESHAEPPSRRRRRKAIPKRMRHMSKHMTVWGDRWLPAVLPSTAAPSQQGELDTSGTYTASKSPPPAYRTTPPPLSPVVIPTTSTPTTLPLCSDFPSFEEYTPLPLPHGSPSFADMSLFGDFALDGGEPFGQSSNAVAGPSSCTFQDSLGAPDFNPDPFSSLPSNPHSISASNHSFAPRLDPFSDSLSFVGFQPPLPNIPSDFCSSHVAYPIRSANQFSDWMPPPMQPSLPIDNVAAHFADGFRYASPLTFSSPSSDFSSTAWTSSTIPCRPGTGSPSMPLVGGYSISPMSTPPMYTGPYNPMPHQGSPMYHGSSSGSPLAFYSGQSPQYCPPPSLSPSTTRSTSSSASLYSPYATSSGTYNEFDYGYSSPNSAGLTGSPVSVSSAYGGLERYPSATARTIPLLHNPPPPRRENAAWTH
ncbi:hypothetical protein C8R47DRAFT_1216532 [Mycena vitilis]|nr:hypothetical protein C8R47DRAFT_1216532 [Mycena vitilis]